MTTSTVQYRALVVDDEPLIRQALVRALRSENFVCEPAANGREALEWISEVHYDLVVTDIRMPEHNGHALAVDLLALPRRPVIVVLTGVLEPRIANDLRVRGVDDVQFKPIDFQFLAKHARTLVEAKESEAQKRDLAPREIDTGVDAARRATDFAQSLSDVQVVKVAGEEAPVQHAALPVRASVSSAGAATQQNELGTDPQVRPGLLSERAESPQASAMATVALLQRSVAEAARVTHSKEGPAEPNAANDRLIVDDAKDNVPSRVVALADQLRMPPESYDGFAIASKRGFCIPELADAVLRNPALIHDVLRMANGVLFGMSRALRDAQGVAAEPQRVTQPPTVQQPAAHQPAAQHPLALVIIFALGIGLGWLLSWLGPAVWLR